MRTKSRAQNWSGVSGFETNYKHLSTWLCLTFFATLSCGGRTLDTGGETSFLTCETDDDCATSCVDGRCAPADDNGENTPAATSATEGETRSEQGTVSVPAVGSNPMATTSSTVETTSSDAPGGTSSTAATNGTTSTSVEATTTSSDVRGGTTSSATTDDTTTVTPPQTYELIDGVEETYESSASGFLWSKAIGNWFTYAEGGRIQGDSVRIEIDPPRDENHYAYWAGGDSAVLDLSAQLMHPQAYEVDLSAYAGVSFWARGTGTDLRVNLAVNAISLFSDSRASEAPQKQIALTDEWQRFDVTFEELGSGTSISTIDFLIDGSAGAFDFWVDDLSLICNGSCPRVAI